MCGFALKILILVVQVWSFTGIQFESLVLDLHQEEVTGQPSIACNNSEDGGRRTGTFSVDTSVIPIKLALTYTDSSQYFTRDAELFSECDDKLTIRWSATSTTPEKVLVLSTSSPPGSITQSFLGLRSGNVRSFTTECDLLMSMDNVVGNLFMWRMHVVNCVKLADPKTEEGIASYWRRRHGPEILVPGSSSKAAPKLTDTTSEQVLTSGRGISHRRSGKNSKAKEHNNHSKFLGPERTMPVKRRSEHLGTFLAFCFEGIDLETDYNVTLLIQQGVQVGILCFGIPSCCQSVLRAFWCQRRSVHLQS